MTEEFSTENEVVADLATKASNRTHAVQPTHGEVQVTVHDRTEQVDYRTFEGLAHSPARPRGAYLATTADSFIDLVHFTNDYGDNSVVVYTEDTQKRFQAVLNHDTWRDHTVSYQPKFTRKFEAWRRASGGRMSQVQFAEFLEEHSADLNNPAPADMINIARKFSAKKNVEFEAGTNLQNGDVQLQYVETTKAQSGTKGSIAIPEFFTLALPIYEGTDPVEVTAAFHYSIGKDGLTVWYTLKYLDDLVDAVFETIADKVAAGLDKFAQVTGVAPNPVTPNE